MRYLTILCIALFLTTCAKPGPPPPPPEAKYLAPIMADLHIADALANEVPVLLRDSMRAVFYEKTLAEHGLDQPTLDSILWIVRAEPMWIDSLYSRVGVLLTKKDVLKNQKASE